MHLHNGSETPQPRLFSVFAFNLAFIFAPYFYTFQAPCSSILDRRSTSWFSRPLRSEIGAHTHIY